VDDELPLATALQALLAREGHQVTVADDGNKAITLLAQRDYDLILCDLKMPKVSGEQVYEWLRTNKPHLLQRFVLMTGDFLSPIAQHTTERGIKLLHKPFRMDELRELLRKRVQMTESAS